MYTRNRPSFIISNQMDEFINIQMVIFCRSDVHAVKEKLFSSHLFSDVPLHPYMVCHMIHINLWWSRVHPTENWDVSGFKPTAIQH